MDISKVLDELKSCGVDKYDLGKLVIRTIRDNFYRDYNIYPNEREIVVKETIKESIDDLVTRYSKAYDTMDNARLFFNMYEYIYAYRPEENKNSTILTLHHYSNLSNSAILAIVRYGINGAFDRDYSEINHLLDDHIPRINYDCRIWDIKINDVKVKSFKNGKVIITGLTPEQKERIDKAFEMVAKYRNVEI